MQNILSHNKHIFDLLPSQEDYWDFHLSKDINGYTSNASSNDCLTTEIDITSNDCVFDNTLKSKTEYVWESAVNEGLTLTNIGYTGVDNGLLYYDKTRITNKEFLNIFLNSTYTIEEDDKRLILNKAEGNNRIYDYSNDFVMEDDCRVAKLNGGFFQGFFKDCETTYQVLPTIIGKGWTFEIEFKKSEFQNDEQTLNSKHPENKGILFYIGTRAENKWWEHYKVDDGEIDGSCGISYIEEGYIDGYYTDGQPLNTQYLTSFEGELEMAERYFSDDYIEDDYINDNLPDNYQEYIEEDYINREYMEDPHNCDDYIEEGYYEEEEVIDTDMPLEVEGGFSLYQPNIERIETDNKFLIFDRTPDGYQVHDKDIPERITLMGVKAPKLENYFLLFNRTPEGYTIDNIDTLIGEESLSYDILPDIYRNALAVQIKDDGSLGYKYLIKDCDSEDERYKIESEFTNENIVSSDEWHTIHIKIVPEGGKYSLISSSCPKETTDSMKIWLYLDGKLKLVSKKLPILNLHSLNDLCEKQEAVPYNISLGGGTQGLADRITLNYVEPPKYVLPLEREFAGTFIGYIKTFRFYDCPITINQIQKN